MKRFSIKNLIICLAALGLSATAPLYAGDNPLEEAHQLWWAGDYISAAQLYEEASLSPETELDARIQLGALFRSIGDYPSAISQYQALLTSGAAEDVKKEHARDILVPLAESLYCSNRMEDAEEIFRKLLNRTPEDPTALFGLGRVLYSKNKYPEARECFTRAAARNPAFSGNFVYLGRIAREKEEHQESVSWYNAAVKADSQQAELLYWLGQEYQVLGLFEDAYRQFYRLKNMDSNNSFVLAKLQELKPRLGRKEEEIIPSRTLERFKPVSSLQEEEKIPMIRVGLNTIHRGRIIPMKRVKFISNEGFRISIAGEQLFSGIPGEEYEIELLNASVSIKAQNSAASSRLSSSFVIEPEKKETASLIIKKIEYAQGFSWSGIEDRQYRGKILVTVVGGGFRIINELNLEEYLLSVVPSEMMISFPYEALKAQAVIARSFALHRAQFVKPHWEDGFDLCDSQHCQVYKGASNEWSKTSRAVEETRGELLMYDGRVASPLYHANCGGHTQSSGELKGWGELEYLTGVPDMSEQVRFPSSPAGLEGWIKSRPSTYCSGQDASFRWFRLIPAFLLEEKINRYGRIGQLNTLTVVYRNRSGHVGSIRVEGTEGVLIIEKEHEIRRLLGLGPLRSTLFWLETRFGSSGKAEEFFIYGGGWGHGVGMCQDGAGGMAAQGASYQKILAHYYKNATLTRLDY